MEYSTREDEPDLAPRLGSEWDDLDWQTIHPRPAEEQPALPPPPFDRLKHRLGHLSLNSPR